MMRMGYYPSPFYNIFEESGAACKSGCLSQGDIIRNVKGETDKIILNNTEDNKILGYLIISNSCDLERKEKERKEMQKISLVTIIPFDKMLDKIFIEAIKHANKIKKREESEGKSIDIKDEFEKRVAELICDEANYKHKFTFFLSPLTEFDNLPTIAQLSDVRSIDVGSIDVGSIDTLVRNRIVSLKAPWREKLGHKVGYIFNRISTESPKSNDIKNWWPNAYEGKRLEVLTRL